MSNFQQINSKLLNKLLPVISNKLLVLCLHWDQDPTTVRITPGALKNMSTKDSNSHHTHILTHLITHHAHLDSISSAVYKDSFNSLRRVRSVFCPSHYQASCLVIVPSGFDLVSGFIIFALCLA